MDKFFEGLTHRRRRQPTCARIKVSLAQYHTLGEIMTDEKKKTRIEAVPEKPPDEVQAYKAAPPAEPILITQAEPIQKVKIKEYKASPPPEPPPKKDASDS